MSDPVLARRQRLARLVRWGKRAGYGALLAGVVGFFAGLALDFPAWAVTLSIAGLATSCVLLPLPIVLGYGIRAAERAERGPTDELA